MSYSKLGLALGLGLATAALAACGGSGSSSASVSLDRLPLLPGVRVITQARQCDRGANAFCAVELVVADRRYRSSGDLVTEEHRLLRRAGWADASGDFGSEQASDSPGHRLHLTYATALAELTGIDERWIKRPRGFALALSRQVFDRVPTMALMLETGPA